MFKVESYITPIILSYVDRYITNFQLKDSQVSLWGGDACFHNLELNLQVLEQELQLPFSFVSGSIRELQIHVPWTKITSEPITITINTIECILNLKGKDDIKTDTEKHTHDKHKRSASKQVEAPPGYLQNLINKIVSNIRIHCNNLILKYVEEDIVLSMNVKHLKFESANEKWEPAYTDLSPALVILRKLITINDLTLCLDRRNASGKIEVYQEPMLYKCSMTVHLLRHYHSATANRASTTRLDIYCENMEFCMTEQQVPMIIRLLMLLQALHQRQLKPESKTSSINTYSSSESNVENPENSGTWTGWAWSYVSSVLPSPWDEEWDNVELQNHSGHTLHFGFYVDTASLTFKVSELTSDKGYYSNKKLRYWPVLTLQLQGIYSESIIHGINWFNSTGGISQAVLLPVGVCSCSHVEINDDLSPEPYIKLGTPSSYFKAESLFDAEAVENKGERRIYNTSWDMHMTTTTESTLLERTPAFAYDYIYQMDIPSDVNSDKLSEMGSDFEFSNFTERANVRVCVGPMKMRICSGLIHRLGTIQVASSFYDYTPYYTPKPDLSLQELHPPSEEDFDALIEFIPTRTVRVTIFAPVIELELLDHPHFQPSKTVLFRKQKKLSSLGPPKTSVIFPPKFTIQCQFVDISLQYPMYVNRLVHTTSQLPEPPEKLFEACYTKQDIKIIGLCSRLILNKDSHSFIMTPSSISYSTKTILKPQYWINPDLPHVEITFESEGITINGTKPKLLVVWCIVENIFKSNLEVPLKSIYNSSLLKDAAKEYVFLHLELCVEGIRFRKVVTNSTVSLDMSLGSIQAFIFESINTGNDNSENNLKGNVSSKDILQILFISGPETKQNDKVVDKCKCISEIPLFTATIQYPLNPDVQKHPPILIFNLQKITVCIDPLLCKWLLYMPKHLIQVEIPEPIQLTRTISEESGSLIETPRKLSSHLETVHSISDREQLHIPQSHPLTTKSEDVDIQEKIYTILKTWFDVWKGMYLCGDICQCTIYFPLTSLSAVGSQGIQEAVDQAVNQEPAPDIMVITLPFANIRSSQRQGIGKYLRALPVSLQENLWSIDRSSFPWTASVSELSCYTIQSGNKLVFLKPVCLSATVGLSTRTSKLDVNDFSSENVPSTTNKSDIASLGICVHIDMTPVMISTSEVQVCLFASVLYGLTEVASNLLPKRKSPQKPPEVILPVIAKGSATLSPSISRDNSIDTASEKTPSIRKTSASNISEGENVKLTAWVQWTIARFTIEVLSSECEYADDMESVHPRLKLVVDLEDIVSSLDFQSVYLKIKSKIGSASIQHYKRSSSGSKWKAGDFSGIVMRLRDDITLTPKKEDCSFISLTVTRASCQHTHTLWGAVQKRNKDKQPELQNSMVSKTRYITEVVINIQPIDFVISLNTLQSFYHVVVPLLQIPVSEENTSSPTNTDIMANINNHTLPLVYLDCQDIRVIIPSAELKTTLHDAIIFQVHKVTVSPSAMNPICRIPLRPDIYEQAAHARILNIPGSEVEDRQYQLDLVDICISTGTWEDINTVFSTSVSALSNLRGISENPALEWNNIEQGQPNTPPSLNLWNITEKFNITVLAAPAMVYKDNTIICGNSVEVNFVTDLFFNLSLHQIRLLSALLAEFFSLIKPLVDGGFCRRSRITFPYSGFYTSNDLEEKSSLLWEGTKDSGIDTCDFKSVMSIMNNTSVSTINTQGEKQNVFPRPSNTLSAAYTSIPWEILFTAGKIGLALYQADDNNTGILRHKFKRKKTVKKAMEDLGYDGSEESLDERNDGLPKYTPLMFLGFTQPNIYLSKQHLGKRTHISCFNFSLKLSGPEYSPISHVPKENDFPVHLVETKSGFPDSNTGIIPAFLTIKYSKSLSKTSNLDIEISKPTKILCKTSKWGYLLAIKEKIIDTFKSGGANKSFTSLLSVNANVKTLHQEAEKINIVRRGDTYKKFQTIKEALHGTNSISVKLGQIILALQSKSGNEIHIGMQGFKSHLSLSTRPEKLCNVATLECMTVTVLNETFKKLLLNPWTVSIDVCVFWESWQNQDSEPQIQVTAEGDCIVLDVTSEHIKCLEMVVQDVHEFIASFPSQESSSDSDSSTSKQVEKDQHYKDDLRAGAFQFVDSPTNNTDELPMPYQVMFWNKNVSCMAWRYPQPRALTKVRVYPVPYKNTTTQDDLLLLCHLEYWSECRNCFLPYTQFYLSESEVCHLNLPKGNPKSVVASIWRVVTTAVTEQDKDTAIYGVSISPRALAACMRIDSYFNRSMVPTINIAAYITKVEVSLYNYISKTVQVKLPACLRNFSSDLLFPENNKFLTLTLDNLTAYLSSWDSGTISSEVSSSFKCSVLDYSFLTLEPLIEPFTLKLEIILADSLTFNAISKPIVLKFGSNTAHTLAVSSQMWYQNYKTDNSGVDFIIPTRYVICNDTNVSLRFGQICTDEDILLPAKHFNMYSWRSQKKKQQLKLSIEESGWIWSLPFSIDDNGIQAVKFEAKKNISVLICVKPLSSTQKQILICGQLTISNMLAEHFEFKVIEAVSGHKEAVLKNTSTHIVAGKSSTQSIFIDNSKKYILRLRFYGMESAWTGDIPLREHAVGSQPWLVKVPLQERGQFLSVWCRIVVQDISGIKRILAMLWPLFMVKSNLPVTTKLNIQTPTLGIGLDSTVNGKGELQQLYCPGTIDHSHQLTFLLDDGSININCNPYVPLNYSLVDQAKFFKRQPKEDIDEILAVLSTYKDLKWPYFGDELNDIEWIVEDQPLTHVQVRYQNACPYSCSLLVELLPWCLLINTLGTSISLMLNGVELCTVQHYGIIAPPKLEENFIIGANIGGCRVFSEPLQLAKSDWSQSFYMPKITGTIPIEGAIKTTIKSTAYISVLSITSSLSNEIQLLRVSSTHILSNHLDMQMHVVCFAVPDNETVINVPRNLDKYCFAVAPHLQKSNSGISLIQWHVVNKDVSVNDNEFTLYMTFSVAPHLGWSCPIRVDKSLMRKSFSVRSECCSIPLVLISRELRGQTFLAIHKDPRPQMCIENKTNISILCAQALNDSGTVVKESEHFNWNCRIETTSSVYYTIPYLSDKFPELPQNNFAEKIAIACDIEGSATPDLQWSAGISIIHDNELFVRIPYYGDVRVTIINTAVTTFITIESVSQVEISAKDIRVRLSMQQNLYPQNSLKNSKLLDISSDHQTYNQMENSSASVSLQEPVSEIALLTNTPSTSYELKKHTLKLTDSKLKCLMKPTIQLLQGWEFVNFNAFIKSFRVSLFADREEEDECKWELASFVCDEICITATQNEHLSVKLSLSDVQFDNQLCEKDSYDFPVVFIGQDPKPIKKNNILNVPIENLIADGSLYPLITVDMVFETWSDIASTHNTTGIRSMNINIQPISCFIEDVYVTRLMEYSKIFSPANLVMWPQCNKQIKVLASSGSVVHVPELISWESAILAKPLTIRTFTVVPLNILLSMHSSVKMYIALDQSPLLFNKFERRRLCTTPYRLGHALTMHYLSGAIFGAGWVVSSLELLGSPGGLARAMSNGLRDFVSLPYRGLVQGPMAFLKGITHGTSSLMRHVTAGTLQSVTKLASSVARNLDRLTLDEEHVRRTEEQRRQRPQGLAQGFVQGLTGFGISLLGAIGGIAHHPLQSVMSEGASPRSLAAGLGLGIVGVFTKPLSGAAELVALTGQGLLQGAGWNQLPKPRCTTELINVTQSTNSSLKYCWKIMNTLSNSQMLYVTEATTLTDYEIVALILTVDAIIIVDTEKDETFKILLLDELSIVHSTDHSMLSFKLIQQPVQNNKYEEEGVIEMDPASRARVADYVRSTVSLLNLHEVPSEHSDISISPLSSPGATPIDSTQESEIFSYHVSPQSRNYFLCLLTLAQQQRHNYNFPVL